MVVLAQRLRPGHGCVHRQDRYLLRTPTGDGAAQRGQERSAAGCRPENGTSRVRSRRGLLVVRGLRTPSLPSPAPASGGGKGGARGRVRRGPCRFVTASPVGRATAPISRPRGNALAMSC